MRTRTKTNSGVLRIFLKLVIVEEEIAHMYIDLRGHVLHWTWTHWFYGEIWMLIFSCLNKIFMICICHNSLETNLRMTIWRFQKKNLVSLFSSVVKLLVLFFCLVFIITSYVSFEAAIVKTILQSVVHGGMFL